MEHEKNRQTNERQTVGTIRKMYPTQREVLLARLLLHVCDCIGENEDVIFDPQLYNGVKAIAEPIVRNGKRQQ